MILIFVEIKVVAGVFAGEARAVSSSILYVTAILMIVRIPMPVCFVLLVVGAEFRLCCFNYGV